MAFFFLGGGGAISGKKFVPPPPFFGAELRHCKLNIWHTPLRHGYSKLNDLFKVNLSQTREYPCGFSRRHCFSMVIYIRNLKSRQHFRSYFNIIKTKDHHIIMKDNIMVKDHHIIMKDHIITKDHIILKDHHIITKDHHIIMKDHIITKDHHIITKDHHIITKDHHIIMKDHKAVTACHISRLFGVDILWRHRWITSGMGLSHPTFLLTSKLADIPFSLLRQECPPILTSGEMLSHPGGWDKPIPEVIHLWRHRTSTPNNLEKSRLGCVLNIFCTFLGKNEKNNQTPHWGRDSGIPSSCLRFATSTTRQASSWIANLRHSEGIPSSLPQCGVRFY